MNCCFRHERNREFRLWTGTLLHARQAGSCDHLSLPCDSWESLIWSSETSIRTTTTTTTDNTSVVKIPRVHMFASSRLLDGSCCLEEDRKTWRQIAGPETKICLCFFHFLYCRATFTSDFNHKIFIYHLLEVLWCDQSPHLTPEKVKELCLSVLSSVSIQKYHTGCEVGGIKMMLSNLLVRWVNSNIEMSWHRKPKESET